MLKANCSVLHAANSAKLTPFFILPCRQHLASSFKPGCPVVATSAASATRLIYLSEYIIRAGRPNTMDAIVTTSVDLTAILTYLWIDLIVMDHLSLAFCEKSRARNHQGNHWQKKIFDQSRTPHLRRIEENSDEVATNNLSFPDRLLQGKRKQTSRFIDLRWIPPASNDVERLFSTAGLVLTDRRQHVDPTTLETLVFWSLIDACEKQC
ncbi:unnamed protein product [Phytophthora lilii]|uniref:Unnamed protein product n=1 Tax=Phytophthora lilii TaxID=2077276 RepID=A0A9W6TEH6_9STRA|nr:unnamed protein product [Phytophthora lilii]